MPESHTSRSHRVIRTAGRLVVVGLAFAAAGCESGLDVSDVLGSYRASEANGATLPTPLVIGGTNRLLMGTLQLLSPDSLFLTLAKDDRPDTLAARFHVSDNQLLLTQTYGLPVELVVSASVPSRGNVLLTVVYHFAPSSGLPSDWPVQIVFSR